MTTKHHISRLSPVTGKVNGIWIECENFHKRYADYLYSHKTIQDVFPELTPDEREFLISGCTPEDWETLYDTEDEEKN